MFLSGFMIVIILGRRRLKIYTISFTRNEDIFLQATIRAEYKGTQSGTLFTPLHVLQQAHVVRAKHLMSMILCACFDGQPHNPRYGYGAW